MTGPYLPIFDGPPPDAVNVDPADIAPPPTGGYSIDVALMVAERDDLLWLVGHLLGDHAALPPRLFALASEAHDAYDPTRYTPHYWEPADGTTEADQ